MNIKGHKATLVAQHPANLNAVTSGAHSPRLIELRAAEIVDEFELTEELDVTGKIALWELARLAAVIEAIDRDLSAKGLTDRNGKERYLLQRRERYSRRLIELSDRVLEARARARKQKLLDSSGEIVGERRDYVRALQEIALGHDPEARVSDRFSALKFLTDLGSEGTTSRFTRRPISERYPDDRTHKAKAAKLERELVEARKAADLQYLQNEIIEARARM